MIAWLVACAGDPPGGGPRLLVDVVEAPADTGVGTGDVTRAVNGVRGAGPLAGSLDVFTVGEGLVLSTGGEPVRDGPGPDLVVFENAFEIEGGGVFVDPAVVELSARCDRDWVAFPFSREGGEWLGFAGLEPVNLHALRYPVDPFDPLAGGDRFDLADLPDDPVADEILAEGFRCVRVTDAADWEDPDTGAPFEVDPISNGPDVDGVVVRGGRTGRPSARG